MAAGAEVEAADISAEARAKIQQLRRYSRDYHVKHRLHVCCAQVLRLYDGQATVGDGDAQPGGGQGPQQAGQLGNHQWPADPIQGKGKAKESIKDLY